MADWDMIAKSLSAAGKTAAMGLVDRNRMVLEDFYRKAQEQRDAERESIIFERNRAAQLADTRALEQERADRDARVRKVEREDIAELAKWNDDPALRSYVETIGMAADTFGDPIQRKIFRGVNQLQNRIRVGAIDKEITGEEREALNNLPVQLRSTLQAAILKNQQVRDQHDQTRKLIEYYDWQMSQEKQGLEAYRFGYGQFKDANEYRMKLFEHIYKLETEETFQAGRQKAQSKYGIDPNEDPTKFPEWDKIIGKGGPDANLLEAYADRWRNIAVMEKMLGDVNEKLYRMDPTSDPYRYMLELQEKEMLRQYPGGRLPRAGENRAFLKNIGAGGEVLPDKDIPLGEKPNEDRPIWKRAFSRIVGKDVPQTLVNIVGGLFTNEEVRSFYKHMEEKYGIPDSTKVDISFGKEPIGKLTTRDVGRIFFNPNDGRVFRIEKNTSSKTGLGLVEIQPKPGWVEPAKKEYDMPWEK